MKKVLAALFAMAILGGLSALSATPAAAEAPCAEWRLDERNEIHHSHGWYGLFEYHNGYWGATGHHVTDDDGRAPIDKAPEQQGEVRFTSATAESVKFTITWSNGSQGEYTGTIDPRGFVEGWAQDHNTGAKVTWRLRDVASCVRF